MLRKVDGEDPLDCKSQLSKDMSFFNLQLIFVMGDSFRYHNEGNIKQILPVGFMSKVEVFSNFPSMRNDPPPWTDMYAQLSTHCRCNVLLYLVTSKLERLEQPFFPSEFVPLSTPLSM